MYSLLKHIIRETFLRNEHYAVPSVNTDTDIDFYERIYDMERHFGNVCSSAELLQSFQQGLTELNLSINENNLRGGI